MIQVRDIRKSYGRLRAVRGISFDLPQGQVAGLLGPNGAGKSTTIRMITGALSPDSGSISIDGFSTTRQGPRARSRIGYLPESAPLYPEMTPRSYLQFRARLCGLSRSDGRRAVDRVLERCWLRDVARRRIGHLSKGYRQRVGLAGAMLADPPVLILDEPGNGLDPTQIRETRELIRELGRERTMLISSHILAEIELIADRVLVIASGTLRADAPPAELVAQASSISSPHVRPRYVIELRVPSDDRAALVDATAWLARVPGVERVDLAASPRDGWARVTALPDAAHAHEDLREAIAGDATSRGVMLRELSRELPSLEQAFLALIESAQDDASAERAA
ncbi:MAG: ABC transporter ATP-binding protein [Phycisphaerales bacterium]|jgi:ABC-2 type transport system ATP-binding protein|nr:ABC transporter ATP-binding protein [Phycisphaerales bacterium]